MPRQNYVYFMWDKVDNLIKIGQSYNPERRKKEIERELGRSVRILATIQDRPPLELELHQRFKAINEHHEWFRPEPDLLQFIMKNEGRPDIRPNIIEGAIKEVRIIKSKYITYLQDNCVNANDYAGLTIFIMLLVILSWIGAGICIGYGLGEMHTFSISAEYGHLAGGIVLLIVAFGLAITPILSLWALTNKYTEDGAKRKYVVRREVE